MKVLACLLLFFTAVICQSQVVQGYIFDEEENLPLPGADVYVDGTTFNTVTNEKGYFRLRIPEGYAAPLVISFIGYETLKIEDPQQFKRPLKVLLRQSSTVLDEVIIDKNPPFTRKQMLRAFRRQFLGTSPNGRSCSIENEDDISLRFDTQTNTLYAKAQKPLRINNKKLEYKVSFNLMYFNVDYNGQTLEDMAVRRSFFAGTTFFTDVSENGSADKKRMKTYLGSTTHLMHTIAGNTWKQEHFGLYKKSFPVNPEKYLKVTDSLGYAKVTLLPQEEDKKAPVVLVKKDGTSGSKTPAQPKPSFNILYDTNEQSVMIFEEDSFTIDKSGMFTPITALSFSGYMATLKAGDLLPMDYGVKD